jgi:hypothetical protein
MIADKRGMKRKDQKKKEEIRQQENIADKQQQNGLTDPQSTT